MFNVPLDGVTKAQRYRGKTANFTLIYGAGVGELYRKLNEEKETSYEATKEFRTRYLNSYPRMFHGADMIAKEAAGRGFVETYFGRRVPIFGFDSPDKKDRQKAGRIAYNQVVQGTAADIAKRGLVKLTRRIKEKYSESGIKFILFIYDSLTFEVPKTVDLLEFAREGIQLLPYKIRGYPEFPVEISIGRNWGDLKSAEEGEKLEDFIARMTSQKTISKPQEAKTFVLALSKMDIEMCGRKGIENLKALLKGKPGENRIILMIDGVMKTLPYTSGIGIEDKERIMLYTGGKFYEKFES
jgi:hypothetical protein